MKLAFVDVETTGSSPLYDRIIEIGILRVEDDEVVSTYQSLVNPGTYLSPFITQITGIKPEDLVGAPSFSEIKDKVYEQLQDCTFVAHNARFDYSFIRNELKRLRTTFQAPLLCTVKLSRHLYPRFRRHSLDSIIERFEFKCENRHRAFDDAAIMWEFFKKAKSQFPEKKMTEALSRVMHRPTLPSHISETVVQTLPESPGVYIFYGEKNAPLYIGKSINIKDRVLSHFSNDHTSVREMGMAQQIRSIETIPTTGELGALLLESSLIKQMYPLYNRKLRVSSKLTVVKKIVDQDGYNRIKLEVVNKIGAGDLDSIITIARSRKQAKDYLKMVAKDHNLCAKLMGLENTTGACFYHKLNICKGACLKKESSLKYNIRFLEAFAKKAIRPWPFQGPVIIKEHDEFTDSHEGFVIDKWCYLGKVKWEGDSMTRELLNEYTFDFDVYKILNRFLKNSHASDNIKQVSLEELLLN